MEQLNAQWNSYAKAAEASGKALESLNLKLVEDLGKRQAAFVTAALELTTRWTAGLTDIKALPELVTAQGKLASELSAQWLNLARETAAVLNESRDGYKSWLESGWQSISEPLAAVAKPAAGRKAA